MISEPKTLDILLRFTKLMGSAYTYSSGVQKRGDTKFSRAKK